MTSSIQGTSQVSQVYNPQTSKTPAPKQASASNPQDSVHLSAAAQKSSDVDHDGDSH